jgi:hypothetical protein
MSPRRWRPDEKREALREVDVWLTVQVVPVSVWACASMGERVRVSAWRGQAVVRRARARTG